MSDNEKFCGVCGTAALDNKQVCPRCGTEKLDNTQFCGCCGYNFNEKEENTIPKQAANSNINNTIPRQNQNLMNNPVQPQNQPIFEPIQPIQNANNLNSSNKSNTLIVLVIIAIALVLGVGVVVAIFAINANNKDSDNAIKTTAVSPTPTIAVSTPIPVPTAAAQQVPVMPMQTPITIPPLNSPQYSTSDYFYPSDTMLFTDDFLDSLNEQTARYVRNELYARHHRAFKSDDLREYFSGKSWYTPNSSLTDAQVESQFNSIERENKNIIINYERSKGWNNQQ